jgi:methylenetetrahydrofolate--tRNA-(uracil-5-)-methyltransferase
LSAGRAIVVGGGLAGCEAAWQLARGGVPVDLYEMRFTGREDLPGMTTPAHRTGLLGELVCSNSLKSMEASNAHGLLKAELGALGSLVVSVAGNCAVPAGKALAVDRLLFARTITESITGHPNIRVVPEERAGIPEAPAVVASGPLTSDGLSDALAGLFGAAHLFFYDAIAPIVSAGSLDSSGLFPASRYSGEEGDYLNAPLDREQYYSFIDSLLSARRHQPHGFEEGRYFEGCLPAEVLAERGRDTLRFGLMKPVGLVDPLTGKRPYAVAQLRREDRAGSMYNLVGFQTQLAQPEQQRVFRTLPGLGRAEFLRYGSMHRNTFINAPRLLSENLEARTRPGLFIAGQLCGVEGYAESAAAGLVAGLNCLRVISGRPPAVPPEETMVGALCRYVGRGPLSGSYQPMNANFGLLPPLGTRIGDKRLKGEALAARSLESLKEWMSGLS